MFVIDSPQRAAESSGSAASRISLLLRARRSGEYDREGESGAQRKHSGRVPLRDQGAIRRRFRISAPTSCSSSAESACAAMTNTRSSSMRMCAA